MECLANGSTIPEDFREKLFPTTHKEYELRYAGKMRKEDILADQDGTFAVPLQVEKIYNGEREKFKHTGTRIFNGMFSKRLNDSRRF